MSSCALASPASAPPLSRSRAPSRRSRIRPSRLWKRPSALASSEGSPRPSTRGFSSVDGLRLRFTHPLLGTAVAARQTPARRRALNARLAEIVPSAEERARHLALATAEPDGDVASVLDDAARAAHARGAPAAAAELAEQALRLTPASRPDEARRRLLVAADMHDVAGDTDRATALLEQARAAARPGNERAAILAKLARVQTSPAGSRWRSTARRSRTPTATTRSKRPSTSTSPA